jgi:hypothetical protein
MLKFPRVWSKTKCERIVTSDHPLESHGCHLTCITTDSRWMKRRGLCSKIDSPDLRRSGNLNPSCRKLCYCPFWASAAIKVYFWTHLRRWLWGKYWNISLRNSLKMWRVFTGGEVKWSEVKWGEVKWSEVKWGEVKWSEDRVKIGVHYLWSNNTRN